MITATLRDLKKDKSLLFRRRIWLHRATGVLLVRAILTSRVDKYVTDVCVVTAQLFVTTKIILPNESSWNRTNAYGFGDRRSTAKL